MKRAARDMFNLAQVQPTFARIVVANVLYLVGVPMSVTRMKKSCVCLL